MIVHKGIRIDVTYAPYYPAMTSGHPDGWCPEEGGEVMDVEAEIYSWEDFADNFCIENCPVQYIGLSHNEIIDRILEDDWDEINDEAWNEEVNRDQDYY